MEQLRPLAGGDSQLPFAAEQNSTEVMIRLNLMCLDHNSCLAPIAQEKFAAGWLQAGLPWWHGSPTALLSCKLVLDWPTRHFWRVWAITLHTLLRVGKVKIVHLGETLCLR